MVKKQGRTGRIKNQKNRKKKGRIIMSNDYKKLTRSSVNRMICGVCGGLGDYIGVDPTVVRIIWMIASICSVGFGFIVYLIAAIIIPEV